MLSFLLFHSPSSPLHMLFLFMVCCHSGSREKCSVSLHVSLLFLISINERLKEHQSDIKNSKNNTAIARLALNQNIKINFNNTKKLVNYNNRTYGYCCEANEIRNNRETCNNTEHFSLNLR